MCARRFLILVFVLILLVIAGAFAIFQFGDRVLIRSAVPRGHYQAPAAGQGPDYTNASNWIARPGIAKDPAHSRPVGEAAPGPVTTDARVFYLHPTTYLERDRWNAPLQPGGQTEFRSRLFVQSQASAFSRNAEVWAPRYRQAAFGAFLLNSEDARKALNLSYFDVLAAFDAFIRQVPGESPIILAGHSQGALHLTRLLRERIAGKPVRNRIVAAYVVGWPISTVSDVPALGLPPCRTADQTGCLLSWMSFGEPANPELVLSSYEQSGGMAGGKHKRKDVLCVNPITGTQDGAALPSDNPGTLVPTADLVSATIAPGQVGARCDRGLLILSGSVPPLGPYVLPGNNYHVYDYALFWGAIRRDAERRLQGWRR